MNRVGEGRPGREHLARLVPSRHAFGVRAAGGCVAKSRPAPRPGGIMRTGLRESLEREGWDGNWYRRGYFDDGTPLGSASSLECRIDSIAQSWGVISGAANPVRAATRDGGGGRIPRPPRRRSGPALHASVRPDAARSWIHQRISARHPGERRPIHAWRGLVGDRLRDARRRRQGRRAVLDLESHQSLEHARRHSSLQGRAIRRLRRRLLDASACRARRMDLVHRLGRMDVSGGSRVDTRISFAGRNAAHSIPAYREAWRGFEITFKYHSARYEIAVENPHGVSRGVTHLELDGKGLPDISGTFL